MSATELRPRYKKLVPLSREEIRSKMLAALKSEGSNNLQYRSVSGHILISFKRAKRHFWSPVLDLNMEEENDATLLRALIGPEPSIWTMFMFFYAVGGLAVTAGLILGYSQYILGHGVWYFLLIPAGLAIVLFFYLAGLFGKARAREQMHELMDFTEDSLKQEIFDRGRPETNIVA